MLKHILDELSRLSADKRFEKRACLEHELYNKQAGAVYEDDRFCDARAMLFLEWFILERPADEKGRRVLDVYREEKAKGSDEELAMLDALEQNVHDLFLVKSSKYGKIKATALYLNKNFTIIDEERAGLFCKGDLFEARIVKSGRQWLLTNGFCHHPSKADKFIKAEMKRLRKNGGAGVAEFFFRLESMSLRWERSRRINVDVIYKNAEKG